VRTDEPALAELHAAEVAGYDRDDLADAGVQQHVEHGPAGRPMRLAGVAESDCCGTPGSARDERPAVVRRVRKFRAHAIDEAARLLARGRARDRGDEAASLDRLLRAMLRSRNREAVAHRCECAAVGCASLPIARKSS